MKIKWYHYFSIGAYVAGWFAKAVQLQPGEKRPTITPEEQRELGHGLVELLGQIFEKEIEL